MRWSILRNLLLMLVVLSGIALAGRKKAADDAAPPAVEAPAPVVEAPAAPAEPAAPPAPALFPEGLPVALQKTPDGLANLSAQSCNACHAQIHDDWEGTAHAAAWASPTYQKAVERAGSSTACRTCHLPLANQHPRLAAGYKDGAIDRPDLQPNPLWDPTLMSEGVTCVACHVRDGVVVSTKAAPDAPHKVAVSDELSRPEFCATCHQLTWPGADKPFYDTYGEWKASGYATAGVRCQDCHMPPASGLTLASKEATQSSHSFPADPARAVSVLLSMDQPEIQRGQAYRVKMRVQNTGAGHAFPTGSPFVAYTVQTDVLGADGKPLVEPWKIVLGRTVTPEPPYNTTSDTRLGPGEERQAEHSFLVDQKKKAGPVTLRVALFRTGRDTPEAVLQQLPLSVY